jgi:REP element-mobilizing transposase RayT
MSTYTRILYHIVFGSKDYTAFLTTANKDILFKYIGGILNNKNCHPYKVGGYRNHIHILFDLHPSISLSDLVRDVKRSSAGFMKDHKVSFNRFPGWQVGYGAFTYSVESLNNLINYVSNQENHHKRKSFKEELIEFLTKQGVPYNEVFLLK